MIFFDIKQQETLYFLKKTNIVSFFYVKLAVGKKQRESHGFLFPVFIACQP